MLFGSHWVDGNQSQTGKKRGIYSKGPGHLGLLEPRPDWQGRVGTEAWTPPHFLSLSLICFSLPAGLSSHFTPRTGVSRSRISQMELIGPDCLFSTLTECWGWPGKQDHPFPAPGQWGDQHWAQNHWQPLALFPVSLGSADHTCNWVAKAS